MVAKAASENQHLEQTPLGAAWQFRWLVLTLAVVGATAALIISTAFRSTQYQATASLIVTDPRATTLYSADNSQFSASRYVDDQMAILQSDLVAQRTSDLLLAKTPAVEVEAIEISESLRVSNTGSSEIEVQYTDADEATAMATVNTVIETYELVRREGAIRESASAIAQLEESLTAIDSELTETAEEILSITQNTVQPSLDQQYADALARIVEIQPLLDTATGDRLSELRAELADIDQLLVRRSQIAASEDGNPRLVQLYGEQTAAIQRRTAVAQQRDQLLVDTELLSGGIGLSSPALFAKPQITPVLGITIFGAFVGLLAGTGLASVFALRRRKFSERAQPAWVLGTSLLAEVPVFGEEGIKSELPVLEYPASASAEAFRFAATALDLGMHRIDDRAAPTGTTPHTYLITSPGPQEGKTVVTANLALAAARKGRSVLAIDADFGNQRLTQLLRGEQADGPGITEVVETGLDLVAGTFSLGPPGPLHLMSRGKRPTNAPDFFSLPAAEGLIAKVGHLYDVVLIDGPPMLHVAYASILAQYVDRVIVVTRHGGSVTRLEDLAQRLNLTGTALAGYVYNGAPLRYEMTMTEGSLKDVLGERADT